MTRHIRRPLIAIAAVVLVVGWAGCATTKTTPAHSEHPQCKHHGDHPKGDHPHGDHPQCKHHGDHPKGDHPKGDHPQSAPASQPTDEDEKKKKSEHPSDHSAEHPQ